MFFVDDMRQIDVGTGRVFPKYYLGINVQLQGDRVPHPWLQQDSRILSGRLIRECVSVAMQTFDDMEFVAMKISMNVEPAHVRQPDHIDDQCVSLPVTNRVSHQGEILRLV